MTLSLTFDSRVSIRLKMCVWFHGEYLYRNFKWLQLYGITNKPVVVCKSLEVLVYIEDAHLAEPSMASLLGSLNKTSHCEDKAATWNNV